MRQLHIYLPYMHIHSHYRCPYNFALAFFNKKRGIEKEVGGSSFVCTTEMAHFIKDVHWSRIIF